VIINQILLKNYRNYENSKINFCKNINVIIGENAQGKTNILESIYFLAITKSYRTNDDNNLIKFGKNNFKISAKINDDEVPKNIIITLNQNKKSIFINNNEIKKIYDFIGILNVIMMAPDDLEIIKGSPAIRRNTLNIELSKLSKVYIQKYNEYNKILKIRNDYLKVLMTSSIADHRYLDIITDNLIDRAIYIYRERKKIIDDINKIITDIYKDITTIEGLKLKYIPNIEFSDYEVDSIRNHMREIYCKHRQREINIGMTLYGPHRDDFEFQIEENNIKIFGSQGQQKTALISFKLSLLEVCKSRLNKKPILLLDDIFSELDSKRKNKLIKYIKRAGQVIITTNDIKYINKKNLVDAKIFEIKNKKIIEKVM